MTAPKNAKVADIVARIGKRAEGDRHVSVGDIVAELGQRSQGPFLLVPALIGVSPIGGIPFAPTFLAALVAVFSCKLSSGAHIYGCPTSWQRGKSGVTRSVPGWKRLIRWPNAWIAGSVGGLKA